MSPLNMERTLDDNTGICHNGVEQLRIPAAAEEDWTVRTGEWSFIKLWGLIYVSGSDRFLRLFWNEFIDHLVSQAEP